MRNRLRNIVGYIKKGRWRWYTIAGCFALAVTIFTSYALIRPAITMEQKSTADEAAMLTQTSFTDPNLPEVTVSGISSAKRYAQKGPAFFLLPIPPMTSKYTTIREKYLSRTPMTAP